MRIFYQSRSNNGERFIRKFIIPSAVKDNAVTFFVIVR